MEDRDLITTLIWRDKMKISIWQVTVLFFGLLSLGSNIAAEPKYQQDTMTRQEAREQKMEKRKQKREEKQVKKEMKQKGMKKKVKSYGEVILEQAEVLDLTDEQLGKIMRIQMTNKKPRKKLLDQPHKSMKKALKALRDPAEDEAMIRKAGRAHTDDFDALVEAEIKIRQIIDATLTAKQRKKLEAIKLPDKEKMND